MATWAIMKDSTQVRAIALSDDNAAKVAEWAVAVRAGSIVQIAATDTTPAVMRDPTPDEAIALQADDFFTTLLAQATDWQRQKAAQAAADAVAPIVAS